MRSPPRHPIFAILTSVSGALFLTAACGPAPVAEPPVGATAEPPAPSAPSSSAPATSAPPVAPTTSPTLSPGATALPSMACRLPAPKKSEDACKTDADCGVSEPCHAHACVARSKARPPQSSTVCTRMMDCSSADANACACFEGFCALVPPPQ